MTHAHKFVMALLGMLLPISSVLAEWAPSQADMASLPPYCAVKFNEAKDPEATKSWRASMGGDFIHIHHYCAGLNFLNHARGKFSSKDNGTLEAAVREFDYVLTNGSPGFYLRPEILMNRGIALSMMNRNGEAVGNLLKSIELNAKQPRAYATLADLYEKQNNRSKALDTISEGLRHNPDTKSLQHRYTELGGKLPYPAPIQATPFEAQVTKLNEPTASIPDSPADSAAGTPAAAAPAAETVPPVMPKVGSPTNPYCRFCPD
jgi:hypothetical protein